MDFIVVDVETANADLASVCQIGLVGWKGGAVRTTWSSLIDPEDWFDPTNISIHGIDEAAVAGAPTFPDLHSGIVDLLSNAVVASHTSFDRVALRRACERYGCDELVCTWLDTARVVRRAWPQYAQRGYSLANVAADLGISYRAHDAEEDARAAGEVLVRAIKETGLGIEEWLERVQQPIRGHGSASAKRYWAPPITRECDPDGPLFGEVAVFTGDLSIPRRRAADLAAAAGCRVAANVSRRTTLLIVGHQDLRRLRGHEKSSKYRKAEELISKGHPIRILGETDFRELVGT